MRTFLVLGFNTNSKNEVGEKLYLGSNLGEATTETNDSTGVFVRKEFYELTVPYRQKHFSGSEA